MDYLHMINFSGRFPSYHDWAHQPYEGVTWRACGHDMQRRRQT